MVARHTHILEHGTVKTVGKFRFFPLGGRNRHSSRRASATCKLDVLLLRPIGVTVGDLDGKLKTIFDALHLPNKDELACVTESQIPELTYCVMEDDEQIGAVNARYDYLLDARSDDELLLMIHVVIQPLGQSLT